MSIWAPFTNSRHFNRSTMKPASMDTKTPPPRACEQMKRIGNIGGAMSAKKRIYAEMKKRDQVMVQTLAPRVWAFVFLGVKLYGDPKFWKRGHIDKEASLARRAIAIGLRDYFQLTGRGVCIVLSGDPEVDTQTGRKLQTFAYRSVSSMDLTPYMEAADELIREAWRLGI